MNPRRYRAKMAMGNPVEDFGYAVDGVRLEMGGAGASDPADPAGSRTGLFEWSRAISM